VLGLVREHGVKTVVVGLPLGLSGKDTAQTRETRAFAERLRERVGKRVAVELHDERFTTAMAERFGGEGDEDSRAAAHLLESWLAAQPQE
jgi:putative Holliday junction resolvase